MIKNIKMKKLIYGFFVFNLICFQVKEAQGHWRINPLGELCEECGTRLSFYGKQDKGKVTAHHRSHTWKDTKEGNFTGAKNHSWLGTKLWDPACAMFWGTYNVVSWVGAAVISSVGKKAKEYVGNYFWPKQD